MVGVKRERPECVGVAGDVLFGRPFEVGRRDELLDDSTAVLVDDLRACQRW